MLTPKRFQPLALSGDWKKDGPLLLQVLSEYLLALEQKGALGITDASEIGVDQYFKFKLESSNPRWTLDNGDYLEYNRAGNLLSYYIGSTLVWSATATTFAFLAGVTINASGALQGITQVSFPATQVPSADANTLDDYEEQSTTPTPTASSGTFTSVSATVKCTKVGDRVAYTTTVVITTNGTAAGSVTVPMPFTAAELTASNGVKTSDGSALSGYVSGANMTIVAYNGTYPGASGVTLVMQGSYRV